MKTWTLTDLPGRPGNTTAWPMTSVSQALKMLQKRRATSTAGDDGAISVYVDRKGAYRGGFHRYLCTLSEVETRSLSEMRRWLKKWLPRVHDIAGVESEVEA